MVFLGSYDANTTDPTDGDIGGTYVVTVAGTGVASFWSTSLEVGDVIIQENATATTEADWVVVSRDIIPASETVAGVVELATQAEVNTGTDTTRVVTPDTLSNYSGFPTGTPEGTAVLSTGETVGKLLQADGDNSCSWVAAPSGTPEGTAILSTGETGGTKYLREDGDGTCSWQAAGGSSPLTTKGDLYGFSTVDARLAVGADDLVLTADSAEATGLKWAAAGGSGDFLADGTVAMTGELDLGANAIGGTMQSITATASPGTTTLDWGSGNIAKLTLRWDEDCDLNFTAPTKPGEFTLIVEQNVDFGGTITWDTTMKWSGGTAPTLTNTANAIDVIRITYDGTNYYGTSDLNFS